MKRIRLRRQTEADPNDSVQVFNDAVSDLLGKLRAAEAAQPLPEGWAYERHDVSRMRPDGSFEFTVISTPVRVFTD